MKNGEGQLIVAFLKGNWVRTHEEWNGQYDNITDHFTCFYLKKKKKEINIL